MSDTDIAGAGSSASQAGGETSAKDMVAGALQTVKEEAAGIASTVGDKANDQFEHGRQTATQTMGDFASAIRRAGEDLAQHDQTMAGRLVKQAADGLEGISRSLTDKSPEDMLHAARDFGRQNPVAFAAGAVLVGLALGRFVRSSETHGSSASQAPSSAGDASFTPTPRGALSDATSGSSAARATGQTGNDPNPWSSSSKV